LNGAPLRFYLERGGSYVEGQDIADWLAAEQELTAKLEINKPKSRTVAAGARNLNFRRRLTSNELWPLYKGQGGYSLQVVWVSQPEEIQGGDGHPFPRTSRT
jgi:hypothetical protein